MTTPSLSSYGSFDLSSDASPRRPPKHAKIWTTSLAKVASPGVGMAYDVNNKPMSVNTFGSVNPDVTSEVDLNTTSETDVEDRKQYEPNILERALERTICYHPRRRSKVTKVTIGLLCGIVLMLHTVILMTTPIYVASMRKTGGDEAVVLLSLVVTMVPVVLLLTLLLRHAYDKTITLRPTAPKWIYLLLAATWALRFNMAVFTSDPDRTPWSLQPGLYSATSIPFTMAAYMIATKKLVSCRRFMCAIVMLVSVFISLEPRIWALQGSDDEVLFPSPFKWEQVVWPALFSLSALPGAIYLVAAGHEIKKNTVQFFSLSSSAMLFGSLLLALSAFSNFIPHYGRVDSFPQFWEAIEKGAKCTFGYTPGCEHCLLKLLVMSGSVMALNVLSFLLLSVSDGAILLTLIQGLATPLADTVWQVFHYSYTADSLDWSPAWTDSAIFLINGACMGVPCVIVYAVFARQDSKKVKKEQKGYSDVSSSEYDWD